MKLGTQQHASELRKNNLQVYQEAIKKKQLTPEMLGLLLLIADVLDHVATGSDMYMIIGTTKDRTAFSFNLKHATGNQPGYGADLEELSLKAYSLL